MKARNGDDIETAFGAGASLATMPLTGACCDPTAGTCSILGQATCTSGGGVYQGDNTTCSPNPCPVPCTLLGDVNQDGAVNGLDIDGFIRAKLNQPALPGDNPACADYGTGTLDGDLAAFVADLVG